MSGKNVFLCILQVFLLFGLLIFMFNVSPIKALTNVIVITPTGEVSPIEAPINRTSPDVYTLLDNIYNTTIDVQRSNITIDGNGFMLYGSGWSETGLLKVYGISLTPPQYASKAAGNVTIKNIRIENFNYGFFFNKTSLNVLYGNSIINNERGLYTIDSDSNTFFENTVTDNYRGFWVSLDSNNNNVSRNSFVNNELWVSESFYNKILLNTITSGGIDFFGFSRYGTIFGNNLTDSGLDITQSSNNNITKNNLVRGYFLDWDSYKLTVKDNFENGKPIVYLEDVSDFVLAGEDVGQVTLVKCNRMRVENLSISDTGFGITVWASNNTVISGNNITSTSSGIYVSSLQGAYNNTVIGNHISGCSDYGILGNLIHGSVIAKNTVTNCRFGIHVFGYIMFNYVTPLRITIIGNNITGNYNGLVLDRTINVDVVGNYIKANNNTGIWVPASSKIKLYHNNFINNTAQAVAEAPQDVHVWDNGFPSGGNYWSDYSGVDLNYDGIGEDPYFVVTQQSQTTQVDRYPLMAPISIFYAGTWNNTAYNMEVVSNSTTTNFSFNPDAIPYPTLSFNIEGESGTIGFCRVAIPKGLMWCDDLDEWTITVGGTLTTPVTRMEQDNYTYLYFLYLHSTKTVQIKSTHALPETQSWIIPSLLITPVLLTTLIFRKRHYRERGVQK